MASLADLERDHKQEEFEDQGESILMEDDIIEAASLLTKSLNLFNYLSDPDLRPQLSERERASMVRVSTKIKTFLGEISDHYLE